jgi:hypothetical protein
MCEHPTPESTRRDGVPACAIRLADGNDWSLAKPTVRLMPRVEVQPDQFGRPVERTIVDLTFGYPPSIQRKLDDLRSSWEYESVASQYEAFFSLAGSLLIRAHDISIATAYELLAVSDDELARLVGQVIALVSTEEKTEEILPSESI